MTESIKAIKIKSSMLFNLDSANNTILSCFFLFLLIISLCFLIPAATEKVFNLIAELVINTGVPTKKQKSDTETLPIIVGAKIRKFLL